MGYTATKPFEPSRERLLLHAGTFSHSGTPLGLDDCVGQHARPGRRRRSGVTRDLDIISQCLNFSRS